MGNIRPTFIKRSAVELLKRYPNRFNDDFQNNKEQAQLLADFHSTDVRNKVAGYITRYYKVMSGRE